MYWFSKTFTFSCKILKVMFPNNSSYTNFLSLFVIENSRTFLYALRVRLKLCNFCIFPSVIISVYFRFALYSSSTNFHKITGHKCLLSTIDFTKGYVFYLLRCISILKTIVSFSNITFVLRIIFFISNNVFLQAPIIHHFW